MLRSSVLFRSIIIVTIGVLVFLTLYSVIPLFHRPSEVHATGSMPLLQLPWPAGQQHNISGGDTYGCGGHVQPHDNYAIDFNLPSGSSVSAVADGMAHFAAEINKSTGQYYDYGLFVWISHTNNYVSLYAHLSAFPAGVKIGDAYLVIQGEVIGLSGATGAASGPHLHFSLRSGATDWKGSAGGASAIPEPMSGYSGFGQYGIHGPINKNPINCQPNNPSPMFISQTPPVLSVSTSISAPNSVALNQPLTASYTVTNTGTVPFNLQSLDVIVSDSNNKDVLSLGDNNNTPIPPQTSRSFATTITSISSKCKTCSAGTYTASAAVLFPDGVWWQNLPVASGVQNSVQINVTLPVFTIVPSPNTSDGCNNGLVATSASAPNDVWAVGNEDCGNPVMLIEHWDGAKWSIFSNPALPAGSTSSLVAVSAQSANNVWVMGSISIPGQGSFNFVAYWNGATWTVVPTQIFPYLGGLTGIKALSANNVWVVGLYLDQNTNIWKTMIANWDGTQWTIVPSPNAGVLSGSYNSLEAVTATSATDIWAVGYYQVSSQSNPMYTLIEHYDGIQWSIIPSPTPTSSTCNSSDCSDLVSVTATSSTDAWAISHGFIEHWNGIRWKIMFSSSTANIDLMGVAASSSKDVWVAGSLYDASQNVNLPLVEHWNGTQWNSIATPPIPIRGSAYFDGVTALSASTVWVVGDYSGKTLTELYN